MVAQAEAVHLPLLVADPDGAFARDQLLVVALGELLTRLLVRRVGLAPEHLGGTRALDAHLALGVRVLGEGLLRVGHLQGIVEHDDLAGVGDVEPLERLQHVEADAAGVKGVVGRDLGPLEHEPDPPTGQIEAHRHLRVALVGPVATAEPPADALGGVVEVEVHALVEVRLRTELVHVLVLRFQSHGHGWHRT